MKRICLSMPASKIATVALLAAVLALSGCGSPIPEIVPVRGQVTLDGEPLQRVQLRFIPLEPGLDGNTIASGTTDMDGNYSLVMPTGQAGACACECAVTIQEGEMPAEIRDAENAQVAATRYLESLNNRPIPKKYRLMNDTPLKFTVTPDQQVYDLELTR